MCDGPARSTEAWVMSHGETMMERREGMRGEEIGQRVPLEISMDTEVLVPDSPTMANLFQAVTRYGEYEYINRECSFSPGMVNDFARDQMATLANRLIEALPANIRVSIREKELKRQEIVSEFEWCLRWSFSFSCNRSFSHSLPRLFFVSSG